RLDNAGLAKVVILRAPKKVTIDIHTSRPGIVIGRKGAEVDKLREELQLLTKKDISLNIIEVKRPELNARLVADSIARQLEGRVSYRRAMKKSIQATMKMGAEGIKIICGGRLGGAEIARNERYMEGRIPLHTLRADIDYYNATAHTTYGCIGVKVWICKGMILGAGEMEVKDEAEKQVARPEVDMPARHDKNRRDDRPRNRRPRGRVRRSRGPEGQGDRPADNRPSTRSSKVSAPYKGGGKGDGAPREARPTAPKPRTDSAPQNEPRPKSNKPAGEKKDSSASEQKDS
ncbi:MAG: 30S ribosomal protein S3, partial [Candidatus Zixiibacteriota bacterium]